MPVFTKFWKHPANGNSDQVQLTERGPVLQVEIAIPETLAKLYAEKNLPIPQPKTGFALIDTGASGTCVDAECLNSLQINPIGECPISTPSGTSVQTIHPCKISFPGTPIGTLEFNSVIATELKNQGIIALLGRDILQHFIIIYNGVEGMWTLTY